MKKLLSFIIALLLNSFSTGITHAETIVDPPLDASTEDSFSIFDPLSDGTGTTKSSSSAQTGIIDLSNLKANMDFCLKVPRTKAEYEGNPEDIDRYPDLPYRVTIIEEPLQAKDQGSPGQDYYSKICYRTTFSYKDVNGLPQIDSVLTKNCEAQTILNQMKSESQKALDLKVSCRQVQVMLTKGGTSTITAYISMIYQFAAGIGGLIAVLIIIINGIMISASGGDADAISGAKGRIVKSLVGLAVLFSSALILYTVNPTFFTY